MKKMKRIMALLLAVMLVLGMSMTVFADEKGTPTEQPKHTEDVKVDSDNKSPDITKHKFFAYQIFKGTQAAGDTTGKLASIEWGVGVNPKDLLDALKSPNEFGEGEANEFYSIVYNEENPNDSAVDVANVIFSWIEDDELDDVDVDVKARAFARYVNAHIAKGQGTEVPNEGSVQLDAGYYLIVDETENLNGGTNTAYNLSLLQLTQKGPFEIKNKTDIPTVEKKVQEKNDSTGDITDWQDAADYDVSDMVPFQLTGTLPQNYADYFTYKYIFHDTLSAGLTFSTDVNVNEFTVNAVYTQINDDGEEVTTTRNITGYFEYKAVKDDDTGETKLTISCDDLKAKDKENGYLTKDSKIVVTYKAELNSASNIGAEGNPNEVYLQYSNNPNWRGSGDNKDEPTGKTPPDKVIVFTYEIDANKVDENGTALPGAGFTLYKWIDEEDTDVEDTDAEDAEGADTTDEEDKWVAVSAEKTGGTEFKFERIDAGRYKLVETTVPDGYNKADDIEFEVRAGYDTESRDPELTSLKVYGKDENGKFNKLISVDSDNPDDADDIIFTLVHDQNGNVDGVSTNIENKSGITLPETGGIGTTIFYVVGGVLVVGCGVILLTRKRIRK